MYSSDPIAMHEISNPQYAMNAAFSVDLPRFADLSSSRFFDRCISAKGKAIVVYFLPGLFVLITAVTAEIPRAWYPLSAIVKAK